MHQMPWRLKFTYELSIKTVRTAYLAILDASKWLFQAHHYAKLVKSLAKKKITILIPTYARGAQADHFDSLCRLLSEYLPNQTFQNFEVLVYCDGRNPLVHDFVKSLQDDRIRYFETKETLARWGHPQTRLGIKMATGDFFVRMNDDNIPYKHYLATLISGFYDESIDITYARVKFGGDARKAYWAYLKKSFLIPGDKIGALQNGNIDCMCYMLKTATARSFVDSWLDSRAADWWFIDTCINKGIKFRFIDRIVGIKR